MTRESDNSPPSSVVVSEVIAAVERGTGLRHGYLEQTGGNCAAIRWDLTDQGYLLVTHGDSFIAGCSDAQARVPGWEVGAYLDDRLVTLESIADSSNDALVTCLLRLVDVRDSVEEVDVRR